MPLLKPPRGSQVNKSHPLSRYLVGGWILNEGTGDKVFDVSGNGNHGTLTNMDASTDWVVGEKGWALDFESGTSAEHVILPNSFSSVSAFSFLQILIGDNAPETGIHQSLNIQDLYGFSWGHSSSTFRQAVFIQDSGGYKAAKLTTTLSANTQYVIVGTWDSVNLRAYLNGVEEASTSTTSSLATGSGSSVIGNSVSPISAKAFDGINTVTAIWDRKLSNVEVKQLSQDPFGLFRLYQRPPLFVPAPPVGGGYPSAYYDASRIYSNPGMM